MPLKVAKTFFKIHNTKVESIDCYDQIYTFKATSEQIKILVKNLHFCSINLGISKDSIDQISEKWDKQVKTKGKAEPLTREDLYDWRRLNYIEENSC
jgi:hypothetical protein